MATSVSPRFTDTGKWQRFVYTNMTMEEPADGLPEGFIAVPYYKVWAKYLVEATPETMPDNEWLYVSFALWYHGEVVGHDHSGLKCSEMVFKKANMGFYHRPIPKQIFEAIPVAANISEKMKEQIYTSVEMHSSTLSKSPEEDELDLLAFRSLVYTTIKLWNPINDDLMMAAAKKVRNWTQCPLFQLFNQNRTYYIRKDDETEDDMYVKFRRAMAYMAWNKMMVERVIYYDVMQKLTY